ncbi:MAG TPA: NADPH-dependent glutamate synthase [Acidimicrobiia bacterium]|nr:NADPH-dependent glutamate synthase [Acidimicrobiia bacterium]
MTEMSRKEKMALPRTEMPERPGRERAVSFEEVNLGFTDQLAVLEASRCLQCPHPRCIEGCPVGVRIDEFVQAVAEGEFDRAAEVVLEDNSLPAVCGRVCPQEAQCEGACVLARKERPIAIGHLERFVADRYRRHSIASGPDAVPATGRSIGVIGSGPAGLACARDLARRGHAVTVYEALHEPGGVLVYGIPEYRLPEEVVAAEVEQLRRSGVEFELNAPIGQAESIDDLLERHDAVFVGVGAGLPRFLDVPGEHLVGVQSANEFLTRVNLMRAYQESAETPVSEVTGKRVAVIGGGNTALDAVRTALRLGARDATIYYRRTEEEMPARREEIRHAREEGVHFEFLLNPIAFLGDEGWLHTMRLQRMRMGEPDESGRSRPEPVAGAIVDIPVDVVIVAVGNAPNPMLSGTPGLEVTSRGTIVADPETGRTQREGVFAGGDIVTGGATVILAMGAGRRAAAAIDEYLQGASLSGTAARSG